jgi:hypothetical protein
VFSARPRHVPLGHPPSIDDEMMGVRHPITLSACRQTDQRANRGRSGRQDRLVRSR